MSSGVELCVFCQMISPVFMSYAVMRSYGGLMSGRPCTEVPPRPPAAPRPPRAARASRRAGGGASGSAAGAAAPRAPAPAARAWPAT